MSNIRLKFKVTEKIHRESSYGQPEVTGEATLRPVTGGSDENKDFYKWTPGGELKFSTINEAALASLPLGAECYIDITVIPKE